jgi:hypothetical protein
VTAVAAWRAPVPSDMWPLLAAVVIGGTAAGFVAATPILFITTPLVASVLAVAAAFTRRKPEWHSMAQQALAQLPDGQARALLTDLLVRAAAVPAAAEAAPLVFAACTAARQLAALELHGDVPVAKRGRALLAQRLQEASAALTRWQAVQGTDAGESLGNLARELNEESRYQQEAAHEVEALLS